MNAILQQDMYLKDRINVFSNSTGDAVGHLEGMTETAYSNGMKAEFNNRQAAVKFILSFVSDKPKEKTIQKNDNQQQLF